MSIPNESLQSSPSVSITGPSLSPPMSNSYRRLALSAEPAPISKPFKRKPKLSLSSSGDDSSASSSSSSSDSDASSSSGSDDDGRVDAPPMRHRSEGAASFHGLTVMFHRRRQLKPRKDASQAATHSESAVVPPTYLSVNRESRASFPSSSSSSSSSSSASSSASSSLAIIRSPPTLRPRSHSRGKSRDRIRGKRKAGFFQHLRSISKPITLKNLHKHKEVHQRFRRYLGSPRLALLNFVTAVQQLQEAKSAAECVQQGKAIYFAYLAPNASVYRVYQEPDDSSMAIELFGPFLASADDVRAIFQPAIDSVTAQLQVLLSQFLERTEEEVDQEDEEEADEADEEEGNEGEEGQRTSRQRSRSLSTSPTPAGARKWLLRRKRYQRSSMEGKPVLPPLNLTEVVSCTLTPTLSANDILTLLNHELSARYAASSSLARLHPQRGVYLPDRHLAHNPNFAIPLLDWRPPLAPPPLKKDASPDTPEKSHSRRKSWSGISGFLHKKHDPYRES